MNQGAEVHFNEAGSYAFQQRTLERVTWLWNQVIGQHILVIGCSQGAVDLLLARQGKNILALDIDKRAIFYAQEAAAAESLEVQKHLHYICADFLTQDTSKLGQFDTILMTETLEHLNDPDLYLQKAAKLLKRDGKVIIMIPFGINTHPDHKRCYLADLLRSVASFFDVTDVTFLGQWVALCGCSQGLGAVTVRFNEEMFVKMERGFEAADKLKQETIDKLQKKIEQCESALAISQDDNIGLQEQVKKREEAITALKNACCRAERISRESTQLLTDKLSITSGQLHIEREAKAALETAITEISERLRQLQEEKAKQARDLARVKKLYKDLSGSKLGHLQVLRWQRENARSKRHCTTVRGRPGELKDRIKERLRALIYNHPFLKKLYIKIRKSQQAAAKRIPEKAAAPFKIPDWAYVPQKEFEAQTDANFFERVKPLIDALPQSNGNRYYLRSKVRIGIIADRFLLDSIRDAAEFVFLTPEDWQKHINGLDFLLVVSAWRGLHEEWRGAGKANSPQQQCIFEIIAAGRERNIPSIFYSKEDPPNYIHFLPIAQHCDVIFTSCAEVMNNYRRDCGNDRVYVLPFGVNPLFHNPVGMRSAQKQPGVIFSGSWMNKYPDRCVDMELLLDGVVEAGVPLKIIDRNYALAPTSYRFPPKYWTGLSPAVEHDDLQKIHKLYDWALDINTVKTSMTMFANRGYELQACGNLQISNYSVGVNDKLPCVFIANDQQEVAEILQNMTPEEIYRHQIAGIRAMMTGETCFDRVQTLAAAVGISIEQPVRRCAVIADADTFRMREMFACQTYSEKALFFTDSVTPEELEPFDLVAFFSHEMEYELYYLEDLINGFKYTACDYITKVAYFSGDKLHAGAEHDYVTEIGSKYRTVFWRKAFSCVDLLAMDGGAHTLPNGYSIDHFNYNALLARETPPMEVPVLSVVIPVYNNGSRLLAKCFASLRRSTIFSQLHIFLLDGGSTDGKTPDILHALARTCPNVTAQFLDGGDLAENPSRLCEQGAALADTAYVTFLTPESESIHDGLAQMLHAAGESPNCDLVFGNVIACAITAETTDFYALCGREIFAARQDAAPAEILRRIDFSPVSLQGLLIRREYLDAQCSDHAPVSSQRVWVWSLIANASFVRLVNSTTTVLSLPPRPSAAALSAFAASIEEAQALSEFLEKTELLPAYGAHRFDVDFSALLRQLSRTPIEERTECVRQVYNVFRICQPFRQEENPIIVKFADACAAGQYHQALAVIWQANQEGRL